MSSYAKPFKTFVEQVDLLRSRGMSIPDEAVALRALSGIGYYRLSGYFYIFRARTTDPATGESLVGDDFGGADFGRVIALYEFDRRLRLHILDAIERVEVALRVRLGYTLGAGHPFAHLDPAALDRGFTRFDEQNPVVSGAHWLQSTHVQWLANVARTEARSKEEFVNHFKTKYGLPLPIWVVTELLSFGDLVTLLAGLKPRHKNLVAADLGVFDGNGDGAGTTLTNWMTNLRHLRNSCAHHGRVWNRNMDEQIGSLSTFPDLAHAGTVRSRSRVYPSLAILAYLTSCLDVDCVWRTEAADLIEDGLAEVGQLPDRIGCPDGWREQAIWSPNYRPRADPLPAEHRHIYRQLECLGASEVGAIIDASPTASRRSSAVRAARDRAMLLGLLVGTGYRYPAFQLDVANGRIDPVAAEVNVLLDAKSRPWDAARWWVDPNPLLGDVSPAELLRDGRLSVEAARDAASSVTVGG
ncbi:Abi family protein [Nocardia takedensis]|uniref:Abi family protein n=1 Tax=Nocardia takedensis TaxID=259390 RepID=UPI0002F3EF25|nr:Abi family protein [Nocardia takedensis]